MPSRDLPVPVVSVGEEGEVLLRLKRDDGSLISTSLAPAEAVAVAGDLLQAARTHLKQPTESPITWAKFAPRHQKFIQEYTVDLNGKQAAIRAGYSAKSAEQQACRLLRSGKVAKAVRCELERRQAQIAARHDITAEKIVAELAKIGFANMGDYYEIDENGVPRLHLDAIERDDGPVIRDGEAPSLILLPPAFFSFTNRYALPIGPEGVGPSIRGGQGYEAKRTSEII